MTTDQAVPDSDVWFRWLLHLRHGGDAAFRRKIQQHLDGYTARILDAAQLRPGMTFVDIGCGEGMLTFAGIERVGSALNAILADLSAPLVAHAKALAIERGVLNQCRFIHCPADDLSAMRDASVDVVATRAVLAYVTDKGKALREFFRILKPGGRISLAEPIFQDEAFVVCALKDMTYDQAPEPADPFRTLLYRWKAAQFPDTHEKVLANPLTNFTERTLFETVRAAGFGPIHVELHIDFSPSDVTTWNVFLDACPHPWAPSLHDILAERFTRGEREYFEQIMRPLVESGKAPSTARTVYINAEKGRQ